MPATIIRSGNLYTTLCTLLLALAIPFQTALATTPDGLTPAMEDVCDGLIGGTPGLYGLCVAYCEAQDCDAAAAHSGQCTRNPPNEPVLRNYNRKMRAGDPPMPCLAPPPSDCPCLTEEEAITTTWRSCRFNDDNDLLAEGDDGEMFSIENFGTICSYSNGIDRNSSLDEIQLEACSSLIERELISDGISCDSGPEDEGDS